MKYSYFTIITSKLNRLTSSENKVLLGRWTIENSNKTRNMKIDLANEDHCGSCSSYRLKKIIERKEQINTIKQNRIIDIE